MAGLDPSGPGGTLQTSEPRPIMGDEMSSEIRWVSQADGSLAYETIGDGPLILCLPGEGDLRDSMADLAIGLADAGFKVAVADLRGHGDSRGQWARFDLVALAGDIGALLDAEHADHAILVGASISAASTAFFASCHPQRVAGLVGLAPLRRPHQGFERGRLMPALAAALLRRPLGHRLWVAYWRSLFASPAPDWLPDHLDKLRAAFADAEALRALRALLQLRPDTSHLGSLSVPVLDFIGQADPDFDEPAAELRWTESVVPMAAALALPGVGHFPHAERPDLLVAPIVEFARTLFAADDGAGVERYPEPLAAE